MFSLRKEKGGEKEAWVSRDQNWWDDRMKGQEEINIDGEFCLGGPSLLLSLLVIGNKIEREMDKQREGADVGP